MDIISKLPLCIIETIICLLPIQEAARTSILSKEWRYHWIKIPKLVFDEDTFQVSTNHDEMSVLAEKNKNYNLLNSINQVFIKHEGPLHEFTLSVDPDEPSVEIIDDIILLLAKKNTVKKLWLKLLGVGTRTCRRLRVQLSKSFAKDGVPKVLPIALVHLKYLFIEDISFTYSFGLPILVLMIKNSPNLKKLKLQIGVNICVDELERRDSFTLEDYSDICLEHLNELEIINFRNKDNELHFVKLILAKSPMLKKVRVFLYRDVTKENESEISRILLCSQHSSSVAEIIVENAEGSVNQ